jgi:hypothetical protein
MTNHGRKPGRDRGHRAIDWEAAFQYYAALSPEKRTYKAVAIRFDVSSRTVEAHGRRDRWIERLQAIEADAARRADLELGRGRAEQLADFRKLVEASCVAYARQLAAGDVRITASDLVGLIRISLQLYGEPTARVELVSASSEWAALRTRILDALTPYPEALQSLTQALAEELDHDD